MSILIKGMEMPTEQYGKMVITLYPNGYVAEYIGDIGRVWEAVPVPPHGRLVDETDLIPDGGFIIADGMVCVPVKCINDAPTIIPAEEGE